MSIVSELESSSYVMTSKQSRHLTMQLRRRYRLFFCSPLLPLISAKCPISPIYPRPMYSSGRQSVSQDDRHV